MKKIESLLSLSIGKYATRKKLNRSDVRIPESVTDQIESGSVTSELLKDFGRKFPVFMYKTCITLHGLFDITRRRVGSYVNLIQNANGSLEIRYSAIDHAKKRRIAKALQAVNSEYRPYFDSQGCTIQRQDDVTKADYIEKRAVYLAEAEKIKGLDFYGNVSVFLAARPWGGNVIILEVYLGAISERSVNSFIETLTGQPIAEIDALLSEIADREAKDAAQREIDMEARDKEMREVEALKDSLAETISDFPIWSPAAGNTSIGIKASLFHYGRVAGYSLVRITGKGTFGALKYEHAAIQNLEDIATAKWTAGLKQKKPGDFRGYRQFKRLLAPA